MCVLRVTGESLDAELHLGRSGLTACKVFRAGEPRSQSDPEGSRHGLSGFTVDVSRHSGANLPAQITDAIAFLKEHGAAIDASRADKSGDAIQARGGRVGMGGAVQ